VRRIAVLENVRTGIMAQRTLNLVEPAHHGRGHSGPQRKHQGASHGNS
jgi:hypothetical protein